MTPILSPLVIGWLIALGVIWAALLFGGYLGSQPSRPSGCRIPVRNRLLSSLILVVAAWSWAVFIREAPAAGFALLIAVGMTFGFLGDLLMAGFLSIGDRTLSGMAAFGLGHIVYIAAGLRFGNQSGLDSFVPRLVGWLLWLFVGFLGWYLVVYRGAPPSFMRWSALPYSLLLASTAGVATGLALQHVGFVPFALGAGLFLLSDFLIAVRLFVGRSLGRISLDDLIWLTYGPGQMLIVYSVWFAAA